MTGLRNLIFSLGMKEQARPSDDPEFASRVSSFAHPREQHPAYEPEFAEPVNMAYMQSPAGREPAPAPRLVTAQPEILPPKTIETAGSDDRDVPSVGRRDRRDAYDDVEILPSWRGQYRKKK
jgi:hypothetical protein